MLLTKRIRKSCPQSEILVWEDSTMVCASLMQIYYMLAKLIRVKCKRRGIKKMVPRVAPECVRQLKILSHHKWLNDKNDTF